MSAGKFPPLDAGALTPTRDALHAYARIIGGWAANCRDTRKHWWHASLRPSLTGLTSGVIYSATDFELELDFAKSLLHVRTDEAAMAETLTGQSQAEIADIVRGALLAAGVDEHLAPSPDARDDAPFPGYSAGQAMLLHRALASATAALEDFRAGIREETSPIQVWPHHFDLSMLWLPGPKIAGEDPADEERADRQMNFGFVFGDEGIAEPYFYVTAYPLPDALPGVALPAGTEWRTEGFSGAVLLYKDLIATEDPAAYLAELWNTLLEAGREGLCED